MHSDLSMYHTGERQAIMVHSATHHYDTIVIGGGQAGLAIGYYLAQQGRDFVILDAGPRVGCVWRNRWDSLRLFTRARYSGIPGMPFPAPGGYFATKDEVADYLEQYAARFELPVRLNTNVETLTRGQEGYTLAAGAERFTSDNVVVATGSFQRPYLPAFAAELDPAITQLHSSGYRNAGQIPEGRVLVVGAGNSGAEIAVELARAGRQVWLSGRDTGHAPAVFMSGLFRWLLATVLNADTPPGRKFKERVSALGAPLISLTSRDVTRAGVERAPRMDGVSGGQPHLADGRVLNVGAVVWATGFRSDFGWIKLPILAANGYPVHHRGVVASQPGLYFLGLFFQHTLTSANFAGMSADARYIAEHLRARAPARAAVGRETDVDMSSR